MSEQGHKNNTNGSLATLPNKVGRVTSDPKVGRVTSDPLTGSDRGPWHDFAIVISICPMFQLAKHRWLKMHHAGAAERHVGHAKGSK